MRVLQRVRAMLLVLGLVFGIGVSHAEPFPRIDVRCAVLEAGNSVATSLINEMKRSLTIDFRTVMGLFDMSCLQGIVNFGGLSFFNLNDWLGQFQGRLCNAIRDWLTASGVPDHALDPERRMLAVSPALALPERRERTRGVAQ